MTMLTISRYHKIYYKYGNGAGEYQRDIQEFPAEFRMIAGDARLRSLDPVGMGPYGSGLGWFCHGGGGFPDVNAVGFPKNFTSCPNGLAAAITMPSCWNGQQFDASNPSAHMAYPVADNIEGMAIATTLSVLLLTSYRVSKYSSCCTVSTNFCRILVQRAHL